MKNILFFSVLLFVMACQNQGDTGKNNSSTQTDSITVNEKSFIELGGEKQYVEITGRSNKNPVLLFIHGGPGWPQTPQLRYFNAELANNFILVAWDQRGCGQSFLQNPSPGNMTLAQVVADAHELTLLLKNKFKQQKIFLVGYSWGSIVGLTLAQKYPGDYIAYTGVAQVINMKQGMEITQNWLGVKAKEKNDTTTLNSLNRLRNADSNFCKSPLDCFMKQYDLLAKYKGAVYTAASQQEVEKAMAKYADYKNYDWNKGFFYSAQHFEKDMFATDFSSITAIDIPVYFILGRHDWNVPAVLVETFLNNLKAPHKEIIWFENSGHGPLEEEPEKFNRTLATKLTR